LTNELNAAAARLRNLAANATQGDWSAIDMAAHGHQGVWWVQFVDADADGVLQGCVVDLEFVNPAGNARWMATVSPKVGEPLAKILEVASGKRSADELLQVAHELVTALKMGESSEDGRQ
jgi:hypothetical protein